MSRDLLRVHEAAKALDVSTRTIHNWIRDGELPIVQPGGAGHAIRIDRRDLLRTERRSGEEER